jgi:hypothetical protein
MPYRLAVWLPEGIEQHFIFGQVLDSKAYCTCLSLLDLNARNLEIKDADESERIWVSVGGWFTLPWTG